MFNAIAARIANTFVLIICVAGAALLSAQTVAALEKLPGEKKRLEDCQRNICKMILLKRNTGSDLKCNLSKTWTQSDIDKGGKKKISWTSGDARCSTDVALRRADIIAALTRPKHEIMLRKQRINCTIERSGEQKKVTAMLSPKLKFKRGKADKIWINLKELEGPADVKGTVWAAANLEDSLGLFHKNIIRGINKFMFRKCAKKFAKEFGLPPPKRKTRKKKKKKETE